MLYVALIVILLLSGIGGGGYAWNSGLPYAGGGIGLIVLVIVIILLFTGPGRLGL